MGFFSRVVSKEKKSEVEELFSEIKEESKLFEEFLRLHEEKIENVKRIIPQWEQGYVEDIDLVINEILVLNGKLWTLLNKILGISTKEKGLFYYILKEKMNQLDRRFAVYKQQKDLLDKRKYAEYAENLEPYFEQLFDFLKSLSKLILLQINTIKGWGKSASARLAKDLIEKKFFYHLLADEASLDRKIKQHLILIIRTINQFLGYEKRFGLKTKQIETEKGPRVIVTSGVVFYEIRDVNSINFEKFYKLYVESFVRDEREPKEDLKGFLKYTQLKLNIKDNAFRTHLGVGVVNGEVIAITFFETYLALNKKNNKKFFFGVGWWDIVSKDYRGKRVAALLDNFRLKIMRQDAKSFKVNDLDAIFGEVDNPKKMSQEQIKEQMANGIDPVERIKFQESLGFREMNFDYIQPALGGGKPVDYLMLVIRPFREDWIKNQSVLLDDMKLIFWYFVKYGFYRVPERDTIYWKNLKNLEKSKVNGYIKFGKWTA